MIRQWDVYASDSTRDISFLVVSSDVVNEALPSVSVVPVIPRGDRREVYPIEAVLPERYTSGPAVGRRDGDARGSSVVLVHQIRTLPADRLTDHRGTVEDDSVRRAVRAAMTAYFDL
jgi:mRNA-degrading endonuclease toxin of MazEF toxin-antitoxin module